MSENESSRRAVTLRNTGPGTFAVVNDRGGTLNIGDGSNGDFKPTELLLAAIGGCAALGIEFLIRKSSSFEYFAVDVRANKIHDENGNRLVDIEATFDAEFPDDDGGERARSYLPTALQQSHDKLCTVTRTVVSGTPVAFRTPDQPMPEPGGPSS